MEKKQNLKNQMTFERKNDFVFGVTIKSRKYELTLNFNSNRMMTTPLAAVKSVQVVISVL